MFPFLKPKFLQITIIINIAAGNVETPSNLYPIVVFGGKFKGRKHCPTPSDIQVWNSKIVEAGLFSGIFYDSIQKNW